MGKLMEQYRIRRVPVAQEPHLVGMISEAHLARSVSENRIDHCVEMINAKKLANPRHTLSVNDPMTPRTLRRSASANG